MKKIIIFIERLGCVIIVVPMLLLCAVARLLKGVYSFLKGVSLIIGAVIVPNKVQKIIDSK